MTPENLENRFAINEVRKRAARAYNAFFAGAPVADEMAEAEKRLFEKLQVLVYGDVRK